MERKRKWKAVITSQVVLSADIYSMWIKFPADCDAVNQAVPGQFVSLYCHEGSRLLPRPISICEINQDDRMLHLVYRLAGKGTREFSTLRAGDSIEVMGPLGNGFEKKEGRAILIGGGIGIPPMLGLAKSLHQKGAMVQSVLGYRDHNTFLAEEFQKYGSVFMCTEDGSLGTKGNVIDGILANDLSADMIYACGPIPMLRGVKQYAKEKQIATQVSMEERMACGIGACLACVCQSTKEDSHSHVNNKRICKDGPVFYIQDIEL